MNIVNDFVNIFKRIVCFWREINRSYVKLFYFYVFWNYVNVEVKLCLFYVEYFLFL